MNTPTPDGGEPLPLFEASRLRRELRRDVAIRVMLGVAVALAVFVLAGVFPAYGWSDASWGLLLAALLVLGVWVSRAVANAKAAGAARGLLLAAEHQPDQIEAPLRQWLDRRGLIDWVRLMLYHAWATLRHRQGRHAEAAALCGSVLCRSLGPGEGVRPQMLLLLAESSLEAGEPWGAYTAITQLHAMPLTLNQLLQRLGLQVRYEVAWGHDAAAIDDWQRKAELAELMPGPLCGATHAMLGLAAQRQGDAAASAWLTRRAELLCEPGHLQRLREQRLAVEKLDLSA